MAAAAFLKRLVGKAPFKINKILTDNGKEFTDRFVANGERKPTGEHAFDKQCAAHNIEHRLIKPRYPQTNGMVERFNGRVSDILQTTRFDSAEDLTAWLSAMGEGASYGLSCDLVDGEWKCGAGEGAPECEGDLFEGSFE